MISDENSKTYATLSYAVVMLVVGLPVWWQTTDVERAPLPFDKIDERRKQYILTLQRNGEDILPTSKPRIRLSTIHGAKGDEDENIVHFLDLDILSYNEFQRNPSPEHRLQFVGVTRTVSNLYIVNPTGQYGYQI